jgi:hypothetical protein
MSFFPNFQKYLIGVRCLMENAVPFSVLLTISGLLFMVLGISVQSLKRLKNKEWDKVPDALYLYRNPGSNVEAGLARRRKAEGKLWNS